MATRTRIGTVAVGIAVSALTLSACGSSTSKSAGGGTTTVATSASTSTSASASATTGTATSSSSTASTGSQDCAASALTAELVPLHGVAMGTSYTDLVVTNKGKATCKLPASPKITFLGADHKQLKVEVGADPAAKPFELAAGASAAMALGYGSDFNPPCDGKIGYLHVTPPGVDLAYGDGSTQHCQQNSASSGIWVAGKHADPH